MKLNKKIWLFTKTVFGRIFNTLRPIFFLFVFALGFMAVIGLIYFSSIGLGILFNNLLFHVAESWNILIGGISLIIILLSIVALLHLKEIWDEIDEKDE